MSHLVRATLGVRPEHLTIGRNEAGLTLDLAVYVAEPLGGETILYGHIGESQTLVVKVAGETQASRGQRISVNVPPGACHLFDYQGAAFRRPAGSDPAHDQNGIEALAGGSR